MAFRGSACGRRAALTAAALAALLLPVGCAASASEDAGGAPDARGVVDAYVNALNGRDGAALRALAPPGNDAAEEVDRLLARDGGAGISVLAVDLDSPFGPDVANASVRGTRADRNEFTERLVLTRVDQRWYVALGANPVADKEPSGT